MEYLSSLEPCYKLLADAAYVTLDLRSQNSFAAGTIIAAISIIDVPIDNIKHVLQK